jgi:LysR family transcriptional regulator, benzoate and cis,cis-muconate-responsive activator of ben and cat genes
MLPGMELRQLRYFVAVAEDGNISRAAKRIFLTQPALSRQIKALEDEIGQCLLERQAHSIRLTPVGEALLHEARELLQHAEQALERVRAAGRGVRLRVGYAPSLAAGFLSAAVENFTQTHPNAHVELFDLSTAEMLAGLESEKLDVVLSVGQQRETRGLKWTPLVRAQWQLAVNRNHLLAQQSRVTPAEVAREPLLVFCQRDYPEYWDIITGWLREHRQRPKIAGEYDGVDSLMAAVESGQGVAIVAMRAARLVPERVRLKKLSVAPEPLCIAAGRRANRVDDKALSVFVEELRKAASAFA